MKLLVHFIYFIYLCIYSFIYIVFYSDYYCFVQLKMSFLIFPCQRQLLQNDAFKLSHFELNALTWNG